MIDIATFRQFALSLPETDEAPHYEIISFRVKKKVFATLNAPAGRGTLRLSPENQHVFAAMSRGVIYPVPNKWGSLGWTHVDLATADFEMFKDAMQMAWWETAPPKLQAKHEAFFMPDE